jgi:hypothetical protein
MINASPTMHRNIVFTRDVFEDQPVVENAQGSLQITT